MGQRGISGWRRWRLDGGAQLGDLRAVPCGRLSVWAVTCRDRRRGAGLELARGSGCWFVADDGRPQRLGWRRRLGERRWFACGSCRCGSDLVPVGPDVEGVEAEDDGGSVGLVVGESVVAPAGDGAGGDTEAGGKDGDRVDGRRRPGGERGASGPGSVFAGSCCHLLGLERVEVVDGGLCLGGDGEERLRVGVEDLQPVGQVAGVVVSGGRCDAEVCACDGCAEFGDEFLCGVGVISESAGEVTTESAGVAGPVGQLVAGGAVERFGVGELLGRWELDPVPGWLVGGVVVAVGDLCAGVGDERIGELRLARSRLLRRVLVGSIRRPGRR